MVERCTWHDTDECLQKTGVLKLEQRIDGSLVDPKDAAEFARVWGTEAVVGVGFYQELGTFCTVHALLSWLQKNEGAMEVPSKLYGSGRGGARKPGAGQPPRTYRTGERRRK